MGYCLGAPQLKKNNNQPQPKHPTKRKQKQVRWRIVDNKRSGPHSWLFTGHVKRAGGRRGGGGWRTHVHRAAPSPPRRNPLADRKPFLSPLWNTHPGQGGWQQAATQDFYRKMNLLGGEGGWTTTCWDTARCSGAISSRVCQKRPSQAPNPWLRGAAPQRRPGPPPAQPARCQRPLPAPTPTFASGHWRGEAGEGGRRGGNRGQAAVPLNSILWFTSPPSRCNN